jgi:hypothetical protein
MKRYAPADDANAAMAILKKFDPQTQLHSGTEVECVMRYRCGDEVIDIPVSDYLDEVLPQQITVASLNDYLERSVVAFKEIWRRGRGWVEPEPNSAGIEP